MTQFISPTQELRRLILAEYCDSMIISFVRKNVSALHLFHAQQLHTRKRRTFPCSQSIEA
ncbi:hypothetical protein [Proteus penneri]|uniref:hypothetical protein n=1 Tax=Proteus TaxID=583 RepID=UPI00356B7229